MYVLGRSGVCGSYFGTVATYLPRTLVWPFNFLLEYVITSYGTSR